MTSAYCYIAIQPALPAGLYVPVRIRLPGTSLVNDALESLNVVFLAPPAVLIAGTALPFYHFYNRGTPPLWDAPCVHQGVICSSLKFFRPEFNKAAKATSHTASQHRPSKRIPAGLSFALAILLIFLNRLGVLEKLFSLMAWGTALTKTTVISFLTELICLTYIFFFIAVLL